MIDERELLGLLEGVRGTGRGQWSARCPAHEDREPSLSVAWTEQRWLVKCHAGCEFTEICDALGLGPQDLCRQAGGTPREGSGKRATAQPVGCSVEQ